MDGQLRVGTVFHLADSLQCPCETQPLSLPSSSSLPSPKDNIMHCKYHLMELSAMVQEGMGCFCESLDHRRCCKNYTLNEAYLHLPVPAKREEELIG